MELNEFVINTVSFSYFHLNEKYVLGNDSWVFGGCVQGGV